MSEEGAAFPVPDWDRYRFLGLLGSGGMADVYKALDLQLRRVVALKFLRFENPELRQRFLREAQAQARLRHDYICEIYEVGQVEGRSYIAMQYIEGQSLAEMKGPLTFEQSAEIISKVARALEEAHQAGLIHRDVKPANILVQQEADGRLHPYIMDFGLVREMLAAGTTTGSAAGLTMTGMTVGTPAYMSPEQARGDLRSLDARTDVYGLGATLYELVCGVPAFDGENFVTFVMKVVNEEPERPRKHQPSVPADLETIILKCLQKEPGRRYASARSLAEDLDRFLLNEPILARAENPVTRAIRKMARQKRKVLLTALFAAATVIACLLFYQRWSGQQEAKYATDFDQDVQWIEKTLSDAYTAPLHDVRGEEAGALQRVQEMEHRLKGLGRFAQRPGQAAIGRAYLALRNYEAARRHLQAAWTAGYRTPNDAYALGRALGACYEKQMEESRKRGKSRQVQLQAQIERDYKEPALALLKEQSRMQVEAPEYVKGLIALYEKNYRSALENARQAYQKTPWLYPAKVLEGKALEAIGNGCRDRGDEKGAIHNYELAEAAYDQALQKGSSDSDVYGSLCSLYAGAVKLQTYQSATLVKQSISNGLQACENALRARPGFSPTCTTECKLWWRLADYQLAHNEDPTPALQKAVAMGERAVQADPLNDEAYVELASAHDVKAYAEMERGADARVSLDASVANLRKAAQINPASEMAFGYLGNSYWSRAQFEESHGINPIPTARKAIESYGKAIELNPGEAFHYGNMGGVHRLIAEYQMQHGEDPRESIQNAIDCYRKTVSINPNISYIYASIGNAHRLKASFENGQGLDPRASLRQAIDNYGKMTGIMPNEPSPYKERIPAFSLLAEYELEHGGADPGADLERARQAARKAIALDADDPDTYEHAARAELLAARLAIARGQSPLASFKQADEMLQTSLRLNPNNGNARITSAELQVLLANYHRSGNRNREALEDVRRGFEQVEADLKISPNQPEAFAVRGLLLLARAQLARSKADAVRAAEELETAIRLNKNLKARYDRSLEQARELSQ